MQQAECERNLLFVEISFSIRHEPNENAAEIYRIKVEMLVQSLKLGYHIFQQSLELSYTQFYTHTHTQVKSALGITDINSLNMIWLQNILYTFSPLHFSLSLEDTLFSFFLRILSLFIVSITFAVLWFPYDVNMLYIHSY